MTVVAVTESVPKGLTRVCVFMRVWPEPGDWWVRIRARERGRYPL